MDEDLARRRALSSPLRMRIVRLCLHQARTNKQIADLLHLDPATCLHHVRTLVSTGFLAAQPERTGKRGAREVPYLATRLSWRQPLDDESMLLVSTFLDEVGQADPRDVKVWRMGLQVPPERRQEFEARVTALLTEFMTEPGAPGEPWSIFVALHPDTQQGSPTVES